MNTNSKALKDTRLTLIAIFSKHDFTHCVSAMYCLRMLPLLLSAKIYSHVVADEFHCNHLACFLLLAHRMG